MKSLLFGLLLIGAFSFTSGCSTPAYTGGLPTVRFPEQKQTGEHANNIVRNWTLESLEIVDDIDSLLLLEPTSRLTKWNVR